MNKYISLSAVAAGSLVLAACSSFTSTDGGYQTTGSDVVIENPFVHPDKIILQHPMTREIVVCDSYNVKKGSSVSEEVEVCAAELEALGFVKVTDKPRFTAKDMDKPTGNYPSRLYKHDDATPRW